MLGTILGVTIAVGDLNAAKDAYTKWLDYRVVAETKVSEDQAAVWGAAKMRGRRVLSLAPSGAKSPVIRFVQQDPVPGHAPLRTYGWNATEIYVADVAALHRDLENSPFKILGPPRELSSSANVVAMQTQGPNGELIYLTQIKGAVPPFDLALNAKRVDRIFLAVLGGSDMNAMRRFYTSLGLAPSGAFGSRITSLANAFGLDPETTFPLAIVQLPQQTMVELEVYPNGAIARPQRDGELPPDLALVSFATPNIDRLPTPVAKIARIDGARTAVIKGGAGELLEVIEKR